MREIVIERAGVPRVLTGDLLMCAVESAEEHIEKKAKRTKCVIGTVTIDGRELYLSVDLRPVSCDCEFGSKNKNYDECAVCGGKWSTRKKAER